MVYTKLYYSYYIIVKSELVYFHLVFTLLKLAAVPLEGGQDVELTDL